MRAGLERGVGDGGVVGVDREGDGGVFDEFADDGDDPADFLVGADLDVAGARGLSADVDEGGALGDEAAGVRDGGGEGVVVSAVEEGVVGDVEDADDVGRATGKKEAAVAAEEFAGGGHGVGKPEENENE
jgi:hypothetical protein